MRSAVRVSYDKLKKEFQKDFQKEEHSISLLHPMTIMAIVNVHETGLSKEGDHFLLSSEIRDYHV